MRTIFAMAAVGASLLCSGCGGGEHEELDRFQTNITPAVAHSNSMRSLISTLQQQFKSEGIPGLKTELATLDERLEEFQGDNIGQTERPVYDRIIPKLKELAEKVKSGKADRAATGELIQELDSLTFQLPKADTAPAKPM